MRKVIRGRSEQQWRELVRRQARSGLSVQAFCQREGISTWSLYGWRSRLRGSDSGEEPVILPAPVKEPVSAEFIDLGSLSSKRSRCELRVDLGGGVIVQLVRS